MQWKPGIVIFESSPVLRSSYLFAKYFHILVFAAQPLERQPSMDHSATEIHRYHVEFVLQTAAGQNGGKSGALTEAINNIVAAVFLQTREYHMEAIFQRLNKVEVNIRITGVILARRRGYSNPRVKALTSSPTSAFGYP